MSTLEQAIMATSSMGFDDPLDQLGYYPSSMSPPIFFEASSYALFEFPLFSALKFWARGCGTNPSFRFK